MKDINSNGYIIRIGENALIQMCLNSLEAYSIAHKKGKRLQKNLETLGLLWGHELELSNKKTLYCVELATIDTSAERNHDSCELNDDSLELKRNVLSSFWPQYDFLGDFHTHPYQNYLDVPKEKLYSFSKEDYESIENRTEFWEPKNYRVGLVLTIAQMTKRSSKGFRRYNSSTLEFTLGNYRVWLKGYVAYMAEKRIKLTEHDDDKVLLECPALTGLNMSYTKFDI